MQEITLWGTRIGDADWQEQVITSTTDPAHLANARAWAEANGFTRLRERAITVADLAAFTPTT
jgi:hypothetical protein